MKNKKMGTFIILGVVIVFCITMSLITLFGKDEDDTSEVAIDYKELLKEYYTNNDEVWSDDVTVTTISEGIFTADLEVSCPSEEACISLPNALAYINDGKWTFKITAVLEENKISSLTIPAIDDCESLLSTIWEKLNGQINYEGIASSNILESIYYGIVDNKLNYLINIEYSCNENAPNCLNVSEEQRNEKGDLVVSYIVQFALDENNETIVSDVLPNIGTREKVLKYEENPEDPQSYEKEIVKDYLVKNELVTEESVISIVPNEGIIINCNDGTTSCTNISTTVLESRETGYFLNCSYDIAATEFNDVYVSYLEF